MPHRILPLFLVIMLLVTAGSAGSSHAQEARVTLLLSVPEFTDSSTFESIITDFEADNPAIDVQLVNSNLLPFESIPASVEDHLDEVARYVSSADVLTVFPSHLTLEATRAGYFLDLNAQILTDPDLIEGDYRPAIWESYQWENGFWGLPAGGNQIVLLYRPRIFDENGLEYPAGDWTVTDYENALTSLAVRGENGDIINSRFYDAVSATTLVPLALGGADFYQPEQQAYPLYDQPAILETIRRFDETLWQEGYFQSNGDPESAALLTGFPFLQRQALLDGDLAIAPYPGDRTALYASGFALSAGTDHPQEAYRLAKYLMQHPATAVQFFNTLPVQANRTIEDTSAFTLPPQILAQLETYLPNAFSTLETRFALTLTPRLFDSRTESIQTILRQAEEAFIERLNAADSRDDNIAVRAPAPPPAADGAGDSLAFGIQIDSFELANRPQWNNFIAEFTQSHATISDVSLSAVNQFMGDTSFSGMAETYDCYYKPSSVQISDTPHMLDLSPLMQADVNFQPEDFLPGTLERVTGSNDRRYGYPVVIRPQVIYYNSRRFAEAGINRPANDWDIASFETTLRTLKDTPDAPPPLQVRGLSGNYLLILMAAYGGVPVDFRTEPIGINFTDERVVNAAQQVIRLGQDGLIDHTSSTGFEFVFVEDQQRPLFTELLNAFVVRPSETPFRMVAYPRGNNNAAVAFDIGVAYISPLTDHPQACYDFIAQMTRQLNLFPNMPVQYSLIQSPLLESARRPDEIQLYRALSERLSSGDTLAIPAGYEATNPVAVLAPYWFNEVMDRYILEDLPLDTGTLPTDLQTAADKAQGFQSCIQELDAETRSDGEAYRTAVVDCAVRIDPGLEDLLR